MPDNTENIDLKLPTGETVSAVVPMGASDAQVKSLLLAKHPEYFQRGSRDPFDPLGPGSIGYGPSQAAQRTLSPEIPWTGLASTEVQAARGAKRKSVPERMANSAPVQPLAGQDTGYSSRGLGDLGLLPSQAASAQQARKVTGDSSPSIPYGYDPEDGGTGALGIEAAQQIGPSMGILGEHIGGKIGSLPLGYNPFLGPQQAKDQQDINRGAFKAVGKFGGELGGDPTNLALMGLGTGGGVASRLMTAYFGTRAAQAAIHGAGEFGTALGDPSISTEQKAQMGTELLLNATMAYGMGKHALSGPLPFTKTPEMTIRDLKDMGVQPKEQIAPDTASSLPTPGERAIAQDALTSGFPRPAEASPSATRKGFTPSEQPPLLPHPDRDLVRQDTESFLRERGVSDQGIKQAIVKNLSEFDQLPPDEQGMLIANLKARRVVNRPSPIRTSDPTIQIAKFGADLKAGVDAFTQEFFGSEIPKTGKEAANVFTKAGFSVVPEMGGPNLKAYARKDKDYIIEIGTDVDGTLTHLGRNFLAPKVSKHSPQVVGSPESTKTDNGFFQQAKSELGDKATISQIAQRAQELKAGGNKPTTSAPSGEPPPTDLSKMTPEARHDWINQNVQLKIGAPDLASAQAKAKEMFGDLFNKASTKKVVSYLDKDGVTRYGMQLDYTKPRAPGDEVKNTPLTPEEAPSYTNIQQLESDFNQGTQGKHGEFLNDLWRKVEETLPKDTPRAGKLALYEKGLAQAVSAVKKGDLDGLYKAYDVVTKKGEEGFFGPRAARVDPAEAARLSALHVDTTLSKWEGYPDAALVRGKILKSIEDPSFKNAVYNSNAPHLEARYEALRERVGRAKDKDPIISLGRTVQGLDLTPGDVAKDTIREMLGSSARSGAISRQALDTYIRTWDKRSLSDTLQFIDAIEHGDISSITDPIDHSVAQRLRAMLDAKRDEVIALGNGKLEQFNENYFPHMWKFGVTDLAKQILTGRRPLSGGAGFLRPRTYDTFSEGIQAGMEPVSYNPLRLALTKMGEMDRYITGHKIFNQLKDMGLVSAFASKDAPFGWSRINDPIFGPKPYAREDAMGDPALGMTKAYYAPADAARAINNHLSPGLRGNALYNVVSHYNNVLNQLNLSLSFFHGVETGVNAMVGKTALGLEQILGGRVKSGLTSLVTFEPVMAAIRGNKLLQEYMDPGRFSQMSRQALALEMAGGRISMPTEWKNSAVDGLRSAWREAMAAPYYETARLSPSGSGIDIPFPTSPKLNKAGLVAYRALGVALEKASWPVMEFYVPRVKLGVFADMAKDTIDRLGSNVSPEVLHHELGKVWDSVDNRFGQLVYDNLFWNRAFKDISHLAIRSVGWNLGTVREIGGAVTWDLKTQLTNPTRPFAGGLTRRQLYTMSLLGYTALMGATLSHLYGQQPDDLTYLGYAKTGKINPDGTSERIFVKTYVNDVYSFLHAPGTTATNKLAPIWSQVSQLYNNADYFGTQIHPIHASTGDALTDPQTYTDTGKYLAQSAMPFSISNIRQRMASGESFVSAASSSAAILQAPRWVGQTKAQSLAYELYKTKMQRGPNDPTTVARIQRYHELATGFTAGTITDKQLEDAYSKGEITSKQFTGILGTPGMNLLDGDGKLSPLLRHTKLLQPHEFIRVYDMATPQEKKDMELQYIQQVQRVMKSGYSDEDTQRLLEHFDKSYPKSSTERDIIRDYTTAGSLNQLKGPFPGPAAARSLNADEFRLLPTFLQEAGKRVGIFNSQGTSFYDSSAIAHIPPFAHDFIAVDDPRMFDPGALVHETTHIFQHTKDNIAPLVAGQYNYGGEQGLLAARKKGATINYYSREQQAAIVEDYYRSHNRYQAMAEEKGYLSKSEAIAFRQLKNAYEPFVKQLANLTPYNPSAPRDPEYDDKGRYTGTGIGYLPNNWVGNPPTEAELAKTVPSPKPPEIPPGVISGIEHSSEEMGGMPMRVQNAVSTAIKSVQTHKRK